MEWKICDRLWGIVLDNASTNNAMEDLLAESTIINGQFEGSLSRVRCFGHIMNLEFQAALVELQHKPSGEEKEEEPPKKKQRTNKKAPKKAPKTKPTETDDDDKSEDDIDTQTPLDNNINDDDVDEDSSRACGDDTIQAANQSLLEEIFADDNLAAIHDPDKVVKTSAILYKV